MSLKKTVNLLEEGECLPVGCRICGDRIIPELSAKPIREGSALQSVKFAAYGEGTEHLYMCTDTVLYASPNAYQFHEICTVEEGRPFIIETVSGDKPSAVIFFGTDAVQHSDSRFTYKYNYGANLRCGVWHCGRLFGCDSADGYRLRWSGMNGWTDWSESGGSGYLQLDGSRGEVLDILEFGEKLVLVREFGLTLLNMFGDQENYSADITDTDTEKIFKGTAQVVQGKLVFFTSEGLHTFDGSVVKRVKHRCEGDISSPVCSSALGSRYFLSCNSASLNNGAVLCYDAEEEESYLINFSANGLCGAEQLYASGTAGSFKFERGGEYVLTCSNVNFGSGKSKTVTSLYVDGEAIEVEIASGRISRKFKNVSGVVRPRLRGKTFTVKLRGVKPVRAVTATAEECNEV